MNEMPQESATVPGRPILSYFRRLFVAADQLLNVILGGDEDETISSRIAKDRRRGRKFACVLCRILDWIDPHHCEKAIERDEGKRPGQYDHPERAKRRTDYPPRSDWS
ncbi:MAG: hypothetical protein RI988_3431 [Pseudomonadota bacterium]